MKCLDLTALWEKMVKERKLQILLLPNEGHGRKCNICSVLLLFRIIP